MGRTRYAYSPALGRNVKVGTVAPKKPRKRKRKRKPFKVEWFKFPAWWVEALRDAGAGAHLLAEIVLAEAFRRAYVRGDIVLSSEMTKMPPTTRRRAVRELVELGLIAVEQVGNEAPTVVHVFRKQAAKNGCAAPKMAGRGAKNGGLAGQKWRTGSPSLVLLYSLCSLVVENLKFKPWESINGKTVLRL